MTVHMKTLFAALALGLLISTAAAQGGGKSPGLNAALLKMFGDTKAFTAQAEARMLDQNQKEISALPMTLAMRDGKMRADMDLSALKGGAVPAEAAAMLKQSGMDRMSTLLLPDKKVSTILYPGLQSYAEVPITQEEEFNGKIETTEMGRETIDGQACKKLKLTTTDADGKTQEAFVWQATAWENFPAQIQLTQKPNTLIVKFQEPKLTAPETAQFDIPAGYTKYASVPALMQAAMMKMFGGGK